MNSEISKSELNEVKNPSTENFKNIKPEHETPPKEVDDFWKAEFHDQAEQAKIEDTAPVENNTAKEYYDDNGTKYREGDSLLPNTQFEVRGYQYETDDQGRVVSAEGQLRMRDPSYEREMEDVRKIDGQEYKTTDDRGHLIISEFVSALSEDLGLEDIPEIAVFDDDDAYGFYAPADNTINLNRQYFDDPVELVNTIAHEMRHAYQEYRAGLLETREDAL